MKEQETGKRLAPSPKGRKTVPVVIGGLVLALAGAYLVLCALAGGERMWPNTTAMGVDISGLTIEEAKATLEKELPRRWADQAIELYEPGSNIRLTLEAGGLMEPADLAGDLAQARQGSGFLLQGGQYLGAYSLMEPVDLEQDLRQACRGDNFFTRGAQLVMGMLSEEHGQQVEPVLRYTLAGQARMDDTLNQLTRRLGIGGNETTYEIKEEAIVFRKGRSDTRVDEAAVRNGVTAALLGTGEDRVTVPLSVAPPAEPDFEAIHKEVYAEVSDAYLDRDSGEIVPSVTGLDFDIERARKALSDAPDGSTCRIALEVTKPEMSTEELNETLFRDILGDAATRVSGTSIRIGNIKVAAEFVNGTILFPGEEFSFNQTCSPYAVDNGYGKATAYVNGLSKDTVAGGICQASSTLYWAVLKANLEVVERSAHRYEPSYIRGGLDATVYGDYGEEGGLDFRFKNNSDHPIKIEGYMDDKRYLHMTIYGTDTTGVHGEPYSTNRVLLQAAKTIYEADATVPQGTTRKDPERTGYDAVSIDTYQKLVDAEGKTVSTELLYTTKYKVRNAVILFNPADLELWGIDPVTGIRTEPTAAPTTAPEGEGNAPAGSLPPAEGGQPAVPPPEGGQPIVTPPEATPDGGTSPEGETGTPVLPPEGETTPPVQQTEGPQTVPILPPGTAVTVPVPTEGESGV